MEPVNAENYLFHKEDGSKFSSEYISKIFKKYVLKAGLDEKYHFHCLRHTAFTNLSNKGVPVAMIKEIAGHTDIKTTQIYMRPSYDDIRRVLNEIDYPWENIT